MLPYLGANVTTSHALARQPRIVESSVPMLTGAQIRAARALLRWSANELASRSSVSYAAIQRAEAVDAVPNMQTKNLAAIQLALEAAGCQFFEGHYSGDGGPGVRLRSL